jgi:hypothetical protein
MPNNINSFLCLADAQLCPSVNDLDLEAGVVDREVDFVERS